MSKKYDTIGVNYDSTRRPDPFLFSRMLHHLDPSFSSLYLDIGCGTGNYTCLFQEAGYQFIGIDPSEKMLNTARNKNQYVDWRSGTAESTGLQSASVDGILCTLTMHHWTNLESAYQELARVLKPQGRVVVLTSTPEQTGNYWLRHYFPKMINASVKLLHSEDAIRSAMEQAGLTICDRELYDVQEDLEDKFLYCGKHDPEVYFDKRIQAGISSFSSLANQDEVRSGLAQLRHDIGSGRIVEVQRTADHTIGDYLFLVAVKG